MLNLCDTSQTAADPEKAIIIIVSYRIRGISFDDNNRFASGGSGTF